MTKTALLTVLLASSALAAPPALAQAAASATQAASALAVDAPAVDAAAAAAPTATSRTTVEDVIVYGKARKGDGGGLIKVLPAPKEVSTITSAYIQTQPAIQNAYQYVQLMPGALVSTTDPFGLSEQFSLNVHGLGQDELGYVLEGMPVNDIGYYTAYPSQFIDSENMDEISLAQGSADLDSPVISATGGLMTITMLDPSTHPGGLVDASYGSYDTYRGFLRLDSGLIGNTGLRGFASYSYTHSNDWHGPGAVIRQHLDSKLVKEWDNGSRFTLSAEWHNGVTPTYMLPTKAAFAANGINNNYESSFTPGDGGYWKLNVGTFRIFYLSAPSKWAITPNLSMNITPYYQYGYGNSPYGTTLSDTGNFEGTGPGSGPFDLNIPNSAANGGVVEANFQDLQYRYGLVNKVNYTWGPNTFVIGYWVDHSDETDTGTFGGVSATGEPLDLWADHHSSYIRLPSGAPYLSLGDRVHTNVFEPFIGDTIHLLDDNLTLEAGFKEAWVWRHGFNEVPGPQKDVSVDAIEPLPRFAAKYKISDNHEVFVEVSTNFRTPSEQTMFNNYYGGFAYQEANPNQKAEYSVSESIGYRYHGSLGTATISAFNFDFTNRQLAFVTGPNLINESINAGSQSTNGIDFEAGSRKWHNFSLYLSAEYLHSVDNSNLPILDPVTGATTYLPTAHKATIRSPKYQGAVGISYDDGTFFGNFSVKATSSQYATFMNDEKIPGYATANLALGVRLPNDGLRARPELKVNLTNLTGQNYLSAVAGPTSNAKPVTALNGTLVSGSAPTYYLSGGLAAMVTMSQAF